MVRTATLQAPQAWNQNIFRTSSGLTWRIKESGGGQNSGETPDKLMFSAVCAELLAVLFTSIVV